MFKKFLILLFISPFIYFSQNKKVLDSLNLVLKNAKHDTTRIKVYFELADNTLDERQWPLLNKKGIDMAVKLLNDRDSSIRYLALKGYATGLNNIGYLFNTTGHYDSAFYYYMRAKDLMLKAREKQGAGIVIANLGQILYDKGDYVTALEYFYRALDIFESIKDEHGLAQVYNNMGSIYNYLGNVKKAFEYFYKSLAFKKKLKNEFGIANSYNNLAALFDLQGKEDSSFYYYKKCVSIRERINDVRGMSNIYNNLGGFYNHRNLFDSAKVYLNKSLSIAEKLNNEEFIAQSNLSLGAYFIKLKDFIKAENCFNRSYKISVKNNITKNVITYYKDMSYLNELKGNTKNAFMFYKIYKHMNDSLFNKENQRAVAILQIKNDYEKEQFADSLQRSKIELEKELVYEKKINRQRSFTYIGVAAFILMLLIAIFIYNRYRIKRRNNQLLEEKNAIIISQKDKVEHQKEVIEEKNKEIVDSINYAQRIQKALLASDKLLSKNLPEYFVLFKPKDIVSGDFYWATPVGDNFIIITADCTGHGVPGAFMSLLNISKIAEAIKEKKITSPDKILNFLRDEIILALNPEGSDLDGQDGMDCVVISFNKNLTNLDYSAANNAFYIVRNKKLLVFKGDHMPVGKSPKENELFTKNSVSLKKGDIIYTLTDGYADQFGGPKSHDGGKKFKYKQLEELLITISELPMAKQNEILHQRFGEWKEALEQVDDVLIMGIKV